MTFNDWYHMPNGHKATGAWCARWRIVTDAEVAEALGTKQFRSAERWGMVALSGLLESDVDSVLLAVPGCRVSMFSHCPEPPDGCGLTTAGNVYVVEDPRGKP